MAGQIGQRYEVISRAEHKSIVIHDKHSLAVAVQLPINVISGERYSLARYSVFESKNSTILTKFFTNYKVFMNFSTVQIHDVYHK
jgi:hypothetical protein